MYINQFTFTSNNKSKIYTILHDVAYPSTKIVGKKILIFSGKFKNYNDASKLLMLTKSRYKHAKVVSCEGTSVYKGHPIFQSDFVHKNKDNIATIPHQKGKNQDYYCLKVFESFLSQRSKQKNKINYILNKLPQTRTKMEGDKFIIYSGIFNSKKSAQTIAKILRQEFPKTTVQTCIFDNKHSPIVLKKMPTKYKKTSQDTLQKLEFTIGSLDTKGYISAEIASSKERLNKGNLNKSDIRHAFDTQRKEYFNGLYLKTNTAYDAQNSNTAYDIRLEFDLFNQGYYENKTKNEKYKINNQINFYKTVKNIEILKKEQELLKLKKYKNAVIVSTLLLELRVSELNLNNAKLKFQNTLLTEYEYDKYRFALQKIKDELLLFKNMTLLKIPKDLWQLLNQIEHTHLISEKKLIHKLNKESIDLKLVQTLQEQKPMTEEWSDKLRVNFYVGVRKMYLAQNQTLVGVEAKIPLFNYSQTAELDTIKNEITSQQVRLQHLQSEEILKNTIASYKYKQQRLKTYSYELTKIKKHIQDLITINNSAYAAYANLSFDTIQAEESDYLNKYTQAQLLRLGAYEELINIMYLIHTSNVQDILRYTVY